MTQRYDLIVLGRMIGTYAEWDEYGEFAFYVLDFKPVDALSAILPATPQLSIDYTNGEFGRGVDENGIPLETIEMLRVVRNL